MATETVVVDSPATAGVTARTAPVAPPLRLSWGAIIGGAVAAISVWLMLYALGIALGLSTVDTDNPGSLRSSGLFTGIWGVISPLIALFVGGFVAGRGAGAVDKGAGGLHGFVMWGLTTLLGAWLVMNLVAALLGGVASIGRTAAQAGGAALSGAAGQADRAGGLASSLGLDMDDALRPVNERLRAEGRPTITAQQLQAATKDVVQDAVRQGRVDRELLINSIAQQTNLSRADAEQVAKSVESQLGQVRQRASEGLGQVADTAQQGALKAADATGKAFWGVFGALFLGMCAAVGGAVVGVSNRQRAWARGDVVRPGAPLRTAPGEV